MNKAKAKYNKKETPFGDIFMNFVKKKISFLFYFYLFFAIRLNKYDFYE